MTGRPPASVTARAASIIALVDAIKTEALREAAEWHARQKQGIAYAPKFFNRDNPIFPIDRSAADR